MPNLAIFASGQGSNTQKIIDYFKSQDQISVVLICSDQKEPGVKQVAEAASIAFFHMPFGKRDQEDYLMPVLKRFQIDYIVLAGYLKLIPEFLLRKYPNRIVNIHPSLLPKYGGKGMYGMNVHKAVKENNETKSGITIHLVNKDYDKGRILFQKDVALSKNDSASDIANKVRILEHTYYPKVIEQWIGNFSS